MTVPITASNAALPRVQIGDRVVGHDEPCLVIAEAGVNPQRPRG